MELEMDDWVAEISISNMQCLKYIHPNILTIAGLLINFVLFAILFYRLNESKFTGDITANKNKNFYLVMGLIFVLLLIRWWLDIMDGSVARHYNKVSVLGGALDTVSDFIFYLLIYHYIITSLGIPPIYDIIFIVTYFGILKSYDSFCDHAPLKVYHNSYKDVLPFMVNNSIVVYIFIFGSILYLNLR